MLKIGKTTLYDWLKRRLKKGHLKADTRWQKVYGHSIQDMEAFKKFVQDNSGLTVKTDGGEGWWDDRQDNTQMDTWHRFYAKEKS